MILDWVIWDSGLVNPGPGDSFISTALKCLKIYVHKNIWLGIKNPPFLIQIT